MGPIDYRDRIRVKTIKLEFIEFCIHKKKNISIELHERIVSVFDDNDSTWAVRPWEEICPLSSFQYQCFQLVFN